MSITIKKRAKKANLGQRMRRARRHNRLRRRDNPTRKEYRRRVRQIFFQLSFSFNRMGPMFFRIGDAVQKAVDAFKDPGFREMLATQAATMGSRILTPEEVGRALAAVMPEPVTFRKVDPETGETAYEHVIEHYKNPATLTAHGYDPGHTPPVKFESGSGSVHEIVYFDEVRVAAEYEKMLEHFGQKLSEKYGVPVEYVTGEKDMVTPTTSAEILDDAQNVRNYIDARLSYAVAKNEIEWMKEREKEILFGTGEPGQSYRGILNVPDAELKNAEKERNKK